MPYIPLLSDLIKGGFSFLNRRSERKQVAETLRNQLIASKDSHNHSWELAALQDEGWELLLIRLAAYLEVTVPVLITVLDPTLGTVVWQALTMVPSWVIGLKVTVFGWAFGSTPIKNAAAGLVGSVIQFPKEGG